MVRNNLLLIIYLLLALILLWGSESQRITKANFLANSLYLPFASSIHSIEEMLSVRTRNQELEQLLAHKTIQVTELQEKIRDIDATITFESEETNNFVIADIIGYTGMLDELQFILNKGSIDKVQRNYPVITPEGVVGKIISASPNYSILLPYSNSSFKLSVISQQSELQGLLESDFDGNLYMSLIRVGAEISLGDTIVTSPISSVFPKGYKVGVVTQLIESPDRVNMKAKIEPFVDLGTLNKVIVLQHEEDRGYQDEFDHIIR